MISLTVVGNVARVELNRSDKLNAFSNEMFEELFDVFTRLSQDPECRVIVLTGGTSKHFTAGLDLDDGYLTKTLSDTSMDVSRRAHNIGKLIRRWQSSISSLEICSKPVITCIHGACVGAGVDLITAADIRFAHSHAKFSIREVQKGLAADLGTLQRIERVVGSTSVAREWCFTGRWIDAQEALRVGLVSRIFDSREDMEREAMALAENIAKLSPVAVQGTKVVMNHARQHTTLDGLEFVAVWNQLHLQGDDLKLSSRSKAVSFAKL
jgi:Delta3,5-Delta2,4-dienoyl-CoA isomerase